jgi:hypothetical protein
MTPLVDTHLLTLQDPRGLPATLVGVEVLVVAGAALTLVHALRARRDGDPAALLTWVTIVVYGLVMELLSYNLVPNFEHARQFAVSFYDQKLPLYIVAIYPVMLYTGIATARRLGLPRVAEACAAGVLIVAMDVPYDLTGPLAGWWVWSAGTDIWSDVVAHRWYEVPVTSYGWHMVFGGILALLTAVVAERRDARAAPMALALSLPLAFATIVGGVIAFTPFHVFRGVGVSDGVIIGAAIAITAGYAIYAMRRARPDGRRERLLPAIWLGHYAFHLLVLASLSLGAGALTGRLAFIAVAAAAAVAAHLAAGGHFRHRALGARLA